MQKEAGKQALQELTCALVKTGQGLSVVAATVVMTAWNLGICAGILIGGHLGQLLYNLKPRFSLAHLLYPRFCFPIPSFQPQSVRPKMSTIWLKARTSRFVPLLMGITTFMGLFPLMFLVWLPTPAPFIVSVVTVAAIGGVLTGITSPCLRALLLSVNAPETRGSAQVFHPLSTSVLGLPFRVC